MELSEIQARTAELERQISNLPAGSITKKTVNGKDYFYHRWTEDKKRREKYIPAEELENFRTQIEQRKALERELKTLKKHLPKTKSADLSDFTTNIRTGEGLRSFAASVSGYHRRECFRQLRDYVYGEQQDKVFILYGLRRTGKTTMIRQIFAEMNDTELSRSAFIQITAKNTLADVNKDLKRLEAQGFRYVFLDEVTLMEDFIEGAALFSDVFAACGMKIVLSGTDSLGFLFTEDEQLYDRCILLHTTFIPYREFESVLGIHGIDEYIRFGGTMSLGGIHYNETSTFASKESTDEYVDTAIARNIQHSLRCYQYEGHFRHLRDLYDRNELTSAINRVVEDINHRFTLEVLTQDFRSHDLGVSASNLRRDRQNPTDILDRIDLAAVTESLRELLEIRNPVAEKYFNFQLGRMHAVELSQVRNFENAISREGRVSVAMDSYFLRFDRIRSRSVVRFVYFRPHSGCVYCRGSSGQSSCRFCVAACRCRRAAGFPVVRSAVFLYERTACADYVSRSVVCVCVRRVFCSGCCIHCRQENYGFQAGGDFA